MIVVEELYVAAVARDHAVGESLRPAVEEEILDDVGLVAKAKNELVVAIVAVILHHVAQDRLMAERDHRLRQALGIVADAGSKSAAEEDDLHGRYSAGSMMVTKGIGTTNLAPQAATCRIWRTISCVRFVHRTGNSWFGVVDRLDRACAYERHEHSSNNPRSP